MSFLINFEKFSKELEKIHQAASRHKNAEVEWRLGTITDSHFTSRIYDIGDIMNKYTWEHSQYTVLLYKNNIRIRDNVAERKTKITHIDLPYCPISLRLSVATEEPAERPNDIPVDTREIERWTASLTSCPAKIMVSRINGQAGFEVELEFDKSVKVIDFIKPLEEVLPVILSDRPNIMHSEDIMRITENYAKYWHDMKPAGFLKKLGYKPLNFVATDCDMIKQSQYLVSNKLDGVKYVLIIHDKTAYAVSETDAFSLGPVKMIRDHTWFDAEWEPHERKLWLFDTPMRESAQYADRIAIIKDSVAAFANSAISVKPVEDKSVGEATKRVIARAKEYYGKHWMDRNDGIMYTPDKEPYLANKDRPHRTLKWKFPDKISIDLRLVETQRDEKMRTFDAYAQDRDDRETPLDIKIVITKDDANWDFANNAIAEVGLRGSEFYVMRPRYDKKAANFITVVEETLKDMRNPFPLKELLERLGATAGAAIATALLPEPTDAVIESAHKWVEADRAEFRKVYMCILKYAQDNKLQLSNPECINGGIKELRVLNLYTQDGLKTANDISNALYELTPVIFMKTVLPYAEFEISVLNRTVVRILVYPKVRHIRTQDLFTSIPVQFEDFNLRFLSAEIELITVYHNLYQPFPDNWERFRKLESELLHTKSVLRSHGVHGGKKLKSTEIVQVRKALHAALANNDIGVLIGHWGYNELRADQSETHQFEKIQLLTELEPAVICEKVENMLRDITPIKLQWKTEELHIPHDMHLRRTTYYFEMGNRVPLLDTFNSLTYEIVPVVTGRNKIRVGNPYVLQRFFLIDYWMIGVLKHGHYITAEIAEQKRDRLVDSVRELRAETYKKMCGGDEYVGIYKDLVIERRRLLKTEEKFRPYKPFEYFEQHGELRKLAHGGDDENDDENDDEQN